MTGQSKPAGKQKKAAHAFSAKKINSKLSQDLNVLHKKDSPWIELVNLKLHPIKKKQPFA